MEFGNQQQKAFADLIYKITQVPILSNYDPKNRVIMETDTSKYVTTGIISQPSDNNMVKPIVLHSKSMSKTRCNYDVHDGGVLAIILALED